ncbi:hypothetical protein AI19_15770 [Thalassolituus oleivorans 4BN06-13]|nr:hypothetical protein [Thalassolituus oleivorans 4BN06-13]
MVQPLYIDQVEKTESQQHAEQPSHTHCTIIRRRQLLYQPTPTRGIQKWHYALDDKNETDSERQNMPKIRLQRMAFQ